MNPNTPSLNDTDITETSQDRIEGIVSSSINNAVSIDPLNGVKHNESS